MRDYADHAYLHTRICALRSRLFTLPEYTAMMSDPTAFGGTDFSGFSPTAIKEELFKTQIAGILELVAVSPQYTPYFLAFLHQYELQNLKLLLVKVFGRASQEQWYDIGPYAVLERQLLEKPLDLPGLRAQTAGTYLEQVFTQGAGLERLLIGCDILAGRDLFAAIQTLPPDIRDDCLDMALHRLALMRAIWRARLSDNHGWSAEKIEAYFASLDDFGDVKPQLRIVEEILSGHVEAARKTGASQPSGADIEYHLERYFYRRAAALFHRDFHSGHVVAAYLWLLYIQIRNLFKIIDARSFAVPTADIRLIGGA
jgi:hypothetical protein